MSSDVWTTLGSVPPDRLRRALLEVHWATQYIAAAGQSFIEPRDDDGHRAMTWSAPLQSFVGDGLDGSYPFRVSLRVSDLTLVILDRTDQALGSLPLRGVRRSEGFEWLALGLAHYMGPPPPTIERPDFDVPAHPVGDGAPFSGGEAGELDAVAALYDGAAALLDGLVASRADAAEVRCWPHHFDIATLLTLQGDDEGARTVGVGMAPMGGGYPDWYWYVTPYPYPPAAELPTLQGPGRWHTENWTGAVLRASDVLSADGSRRAELVRGFVSDAVEASARALGVDA